MCWSFLEGQFFYSFSEKGRLLRCMSWIPTENNMVFVPGLIIFVCEF